MATTPGAAAELARFSIAVPEDLLRAFDEQIKRRGDNANRSEAIRDLIRASLVEDAQRTPDAQVIGSLTISTITTPATSPVVWTRSSTTTRTR